MCYHSQLRAIPFLRVAHFSFVKSSQIQQNTDAMLLEAIGIVMTVVALWGSWELSKLNLIKCCWLWYVSNIGFVFYNLMHGSYCSALLFVAYLFTTYRMHVRALQEEYEREWYDNGN